MADPSDLAEDFEQRYRIVGHPALRRIEAAVIGSDYGATSYTTVAQADRLSTLLDLKPGKVLLDIGSGAGWPGIYLASISGCQVILTDVTFEGLKVAAGRLRHEQVDGTVIGAAGDSLPFADQSMDASTSSDVLC